MSIRDLFGSAKIVRPLSPSTVVRFTTPRCLSNTSYRRPNNGAELDPGSIAIILSGPYLDSRGGFRTYIVLTQHGVATVVIGPSQFYMDVVA